MSDCAYLVTGKAWPMKATRTRICVVGAFGRMGSTVIREAPPELYDVTGAVESPGHPKLGRSLEELGIRNSQSRLQPSSSLTEVLRDADVCISFTRPEAELENIRAIVQSGKPAVIGTTGFAPTQRQELEKALSGRVPAVITSNFSVGANMLFGLASSLKNLPKEFDVSIMEAHHSGKADAPSGTALRLGEIVSKARRYSSNVHGRSGISKRQPGELEIVSLRGGGTPGEHTVFAFGQYELLKLEHTVFSRSAFAQGALLAAEWVSRGREKRIYTMLDVLGFGA